MSSAIVNAALGALQAHYGGSRGVGAVGGVEPLVQAESDTISAARLCTLASDA
eukprot:CAMPEP_0172201494 /NCGR_PEP_ID=MMETSP1050-20130122/30036_1 /TAXON_ID=233186 /ORGANISM="Cryptomonas curvata, Strain CCAP979/52" /LENGTH=52 /DNA_ID=CAMNT_0012879157 /DNA_START=244 /DNA_END=400 /DNA_ORIENTATION=-